MQCGHLPQQQMLSCASCSHAQVQAAHSVPSRRSPPPVAAHLLRAAGCAPLAARKGTAAAGCSRSSPPRQRRRITTSAEAEQSSRAEPKLAADAIAAGLTAYQGGNPEDALDLFQRALSLPGTGMKRDRLNLPCSPVVKPLKVSPEKEAGGAVSKQGWVKPREVSPEEKQAALYNTACCLGRLGNTQEGLYAVAGCLEAGYADYSQLRKDPDLAPLRESPKFEGLLKRFEPGGGFLGPLLRGFSE